jgi:hypothetical protein
MSRLQEKAKPILLPLILGRPSLITKKDQEVISAWSAMFVAVAEFIDKTGDRIAISPKDRLHLKEIGLPPKSNWKVWIGHYERDKWGGTLIRNTIPMISPNHIPNRSDDGRDLPNTQTTTFIICKLYVHVLSSDIAGIPRSQDFKGAARKALFRVWPFRESPLSWPPPTKLTDADAAGVAYAFIEHARKAAHFG